MLDGLWTIEYEGDAYLAGGGIAVVHAGEVLGGDSWYFYQGSMTQDGPLITANVKAKAFISGATTVFGPAVKEFSVRLHGTISNANLIRGKLVPDFAPNVSLGVVLLKRS